MVASSGGRREHGGAAVKGPDRSLVMVASSDGRRELLRLGLGLGFCGSFTTFSSFAVVAAELGRGGDVATAAAFVVLSVAAAVAALLAGSTAARHLVGNRTP